MPKNSIQKREKSDTRFKPGNTASVGHGRPKGSVSGRKKLLLALDEMLAEDDGVKNFQNKMRELFQRNPAAFFMKFVVPLLPKESYVEVEGGLLLRTAKELSDDELASVIEGEEGKK